MSIWRINNATSLGGEVCAQWQTGHAYSLGARVVCRSSYGTTARRAYVYECTTEGTSHGSTEPTWPTSGTVADNDIVWTTRSPDDGNWDNASCHLPYILNHASIAAGDTILVNDDHSENSDLGANFLIKGTTTANNPIKIICVDKADDSLSSGAIVGAGGTRQFQFTAHGYSYGVEFRSASTGTPLQLADNNGTTWTLEHTGGNVLNATGAGGIIGIGNATTQKPQILHIINGDISVSNTATYVALYAHAWFIWEGGTVNGSMNNLFNNSSAYSSQAAWIRGVDLSSVTNINSQVSVCAQNIFVERCKGAFVATAGTWLQPKMGKIALHLCGTADVPYDFKEASYEGTVEDETTLVRTGGASDGTTTISWKMISSANNKEPHIALVSPPISKWVASGSKTISIECLVDSATNLQNDEVWMELEYFANNTDSLGAFAKDRVAILGTPADKTSSSETWTTSGMSNPNKFKCSVTVNPGKAGFVTARVHLAKASTTIYVDPLLNVT